MLCQYGILVKFTFRLTLMFGGEIKFGDCQMKYAILRNCSFVSGRLIDPYYQKCNFDSLFNRPKRSCLFQQSQAGETFRKKA